MYKIGNKIAKIGNKIPINISPKVIELTVRGTSFPDRNTGSTIFRVASSVVNTMYVDFEDGEGVQSFPLINGNNNWTTVPLYYFKNLNNPTKENTIDPTYTQERDIKITFQFPQKITVFLIQNMGLYGNFPKNIGNFSFIELTISNTFNINSFPSTFGGLKIATVTLNNISETKLTYFPSWIGNSQITSLTLKNIFNFSGIDSATSNFDSVANVKGLNNLTIADNNLINNDEFPVLKNITTLRTVFIGNPFTTFPAKIGECSQVTVLQASAITAASPNFSNWGAGIGLMTSLVYLNFEGIIGDKITTDLPLGMANCVNLKTILCKASYTTQIRIDTFINNLYDFIVLNASVSVGNTKFRQMTINPGSYAGTIVPRPTGNYADEDSPLGKVWRMVNTYKHTWTIRNAANTADEVLS